MSLAAVKARFSELVDRVQRQQDRVVVTRNGKPAAVLISTEDLESLEETLAVMSDRSIAAQIRESQRAVLGLTSCGPASLSDAPTGGERTALAGRRDGSGPSRVRPPADLGCRCRPGDTRRHS